MLHALSSISASDQYTHLNEIICLDEQLLQRFTGKCVIQPALSHLLVSLQANKTRPLYCWYKDKKVFSASLIEYLRRHTYRENIEPFRR